MMGALPGVYNDKQKYDLIMTGLDLIHSGNKGANMRLRDPLHHASGKREQDSSKFGAPLDFSNNEPRQEIMWPSQ